MQQGKKERFQALESKVSHHFAVLLPRIEVSSRRDHYGIVAYAATQGPRARVLETWSRNKVTRANFSPAFPLLL